MVNGSAAGFTLKGAVEDDHCRGSADGKYVSACSRRICIFFFLLGKENPPTACFLLPSGHRAWVEYKVLPWWMYPLCLDFPRPPSRGSFNFLACLASVTVLRFSWTFCVTFYFDSGIFTFLEKWFFFWWLDL